MQNPLYTTIQLKVWKFTLIFMYLTYMYKRITSSPTQSKNQNETTTEHPSALAALHCDAEFKLKAKNKFQQQ